MATHQNDPNANELWAFFQAVISWVQLTFTTYRREMKGVDWGELYRRFGNRLYDTAELEKRINVLMIDDDVTSKRGIYAYVLTGDERYLSIRAFSEAQRREAYERQGGVCGRCSRHFTIDVMQADHITPWSKGGRTVAANCTMLCADCNRRKSDV